MRRATLITTVMLLICAAAYAQAPNAPAPSNPAPSNPPPQQAAPKPPAAAAAPAAAPHPAPTGTSKIAVIDFEQAVTGTSEGKKAAEQFQVELQKKQSAMAVKQKQGQDLQTRLQTQDKVLSDVQKADITKKLESLQTELTREGEDAQRELGDKQQQLFGPIAQRVKKALEEYASENGYGVVFDTSSQANNILFKSDVADITTEIIRRVDSSPRMPAPATPAKPPAGAATPPKPGGPAQDPAKKPNP